MIRWLSQIWVSSALDRGRAPSRLWRWTFGRLASYRGFADQLRQLDAQLKRQAASQQRAIHRQSRPIGHYPARSAMKTSRPILHPMGFARWSINPARPALALAACAGLAAVAWFVWPSAPTQNPQDLRDATAQSFARVWDPLARQAQATHQALRDQASHVTDLPERLPDLDQVVNNLGEAIESPIRQEMQRFTRDITRPWLYLADQLPLPMTEQADTASSG